MDGYQWLLIINFTSIDSLAIHHILYIMKTGSIDMYLASSTTYQVGCNICDIIRLCQVLAGSGFEDIASFQNL